MPGATVQQPPLASHRMAGKQAGSQAPDPRTIYHKQTHAFPSFSLSLSSLLPFSPYAILRLIASHASSWIRHPTTHITHTRTDGLAGCRSRLAVPSRPAALTDLSCSRRDWRRRASASTLRSSCHRRSCCCLHARPSLQRTDSQHLESSEPHACHDIHTHTQSNDRSKEGSFLCKHPGIQR